MGREVGGGFRMGDTCRPMTDSCECMAKIVISLQLNLYLKKKVTFDMGFKVWAGVWEKMKVQRAL